MEDLRRSEVRELARLTARLNAAQQTFFQAEYGRHRRNPTTALLLCLLLGCFGAHYLYFGRLRAGVFRLLFCWTLVPLVTSLFEARTITSRAFRYNASLANELLLALENTVDEQSEPGLALAATVQRATVTPAAERAAIAAPAAVAPTPEFELAAAAWAGREPASDDPADPPRVLKGAANDAMLADPTAIETFVQPTDSTEQVWRPGAEADSSWAPDPAASQWEAERPQWTKDDEQDNEPEPLPWFLADARPAIAAADTDFTAEDTEDTEGDGASLSYSFPLSSSASFASSVVNLHSSPEAETPATELPISDLTARAAAGERQPVFLYEAAPTTRREAVRLGPPPGQPSDTLGDTDALSRVLKGAANEASGTELDDRPIQRTSESGGLRQGVQVDFELASLGSALAAGLADLLRERPARPRSVPLSRPLPDSSPPAHLGSAAIDSASPAAVSSTAHKRDELTGDLLWASAALPPPEFTPAQRFTAEDTELHRGQRESPFSSSASFASSAVSSVLPSLDLPIAVPLSGADEVRTALTTAPAAAYVSTPSQNLRRRVVQRVIVRKMAVVEGHVVAESTVERQVPVVADDDEMAERVRAATADAAREALGNLMKQAPEEALPAIRLQLYALDSARVLATPVKGAANAVQNLRVSRG